MVGEIMEVICQARNRMVRGGNHQWVGGYPAVADIEHDISHGWGYILCAEGGSIAAYGAVVFDGEPTYASIRDGQGWLSEGAEYVVLHRLAVADGSVRQGVALTFMAEIERLAQKRRVEFFRIDTKYSNAPMLALIKRCGFSHCGTITLRSGDTRLAFEKRL